MRPVLKLATILITSIGVWSTGTHAGPADDPSYTDYWAQLARAPGVPEAAVFAGFEQGETVSLLGGHQVITHPSSPVIPIDGGRTIGLQRVFNSTVNRYDSLSSCTHHLPCAGGTALWSENSWAGKGWVSHFGRIFYKSLPGSCRYWLSLSSVNPCSEVWSINYPGRQLAFEDSSGTIYPIAAAGTDADLGHSMSFTEPKLRVRFYAYGGFTCPSSYYGHGGQQIQCLSSSRGFPYYEVTYPDGTRYLLKYLVPDQVFNDFCEYAAAADWIKNHRQNGWYTFEITDVNDRTVFIQYEETGPHPEAIRGISYTFSDGAELALTTELWTQADVNSGQTVAGNIGRLKKVTAPAVNGQPAEYGFQYNSSGYLTTATLPGSLGTVTYEPSTQFIRSITYPTGAVSEYVFGQDVLGELKSCVGPREVACWTANGSWDDPSCDEGDAYYYCLETTCNNTTNIWAKETTVRDRIIYPDGKGTGKPYYSWTWDRFHAHDFLNQYGTGGGPYAPEVNLFLQRNPDGTESRSTITGPIYPINNWYMYMDLPAFALFGLEGSQTVFGAATTPLQATANAYGLSTNQEAARTLSKQTSYLDDTGTCFGEAPSIPPVTVADPVPWTVDDESYTSSERRLSPQV